jgi:hypothetical protein
MIVKDDQPQLKADIELVFTLPPAGDRQESLRTVDRGHGRIETHNPTTSAALAGYSDWPGLAQVFEVVYGVTSLRPSGPPPIGCWSLSEVIGGLKTSPIRSAM